MSYSLGRIGPYLSDRILVAPAKNGSFTIRRADSLWDWMMRIISWIYAPASYTDENRRSIQCFQRMLAPIGTERLQRICNRYNIDLAEMEKKGSPLLSRTIAKIGVGLADVDIVEIERAIASCKLPHSIPIFSAELDAALQAVSCAEELSASDFAKLYDALGSAAKSFPLPNMPEINGSCPTECLAWFSFDQFLADRERLCLQAGHPKMNMDGFTRNVCLRAMRRLAPVGTLMPAPNRPDGTRQFYRIASRTITGKGFVSYVYVPATRDTDLKTIEFFRGTSTTPGEVDAFSSIITDFEEQIGNSARKSSKLYRPFKVFLPPVEIVAGHSLGSTLAQREMIKNPDIRKGVFLSGPGGLTSKKIAQFNDRMRQEHSEPVTIEIDDANGDFLSAMGGLHLGYQAPEKVKILFRHFSASKKVNRLSVHTMVWDSQKYCGIEGGHSTERMDAYLNRKSRVSLDWIRETIGPFLVKIFQAIRDFCRWAICSRTLALQGLQIGTYETGPDGLHWKVRNIKPHQVTKAMAEMYTARGQVW